MSRLPIGYRIQPRPDGSVSVVLETIAVAPGTPLGPKHRQILLDYKDARRSTRLIRLPVREPRLWVESIRGLPT
jgi:hypothetical protein